ncbi:MAG TPA: glutathione S-transferase N-terminal domain-containing protein [Ramlibacter sp.]|nr:glutathione S-transferase N-terminal domain-containing protein [Ramlibacter sp.]
MKLQYSPNSPYVRKIVILGLELGLDARIERQAVSLSPYDPNPDVVALNPLGKIPVLVTDDGMALFDSTVACEYLSALADDHSWFPPAGTARWHALRCNAVANGMLEAAQLARFEGSRPEGVRYDKWSAAQLAKVTRGFAFLEQNPPAAADIGAVAVACAIGWIDFRYPELAWRQSSPRLAQWVDTFSRRESFSTTRHPGQQ